MNLAVLVHTFDGYKHLWPGFFKAFGEHWTLEDAQYFFGTDTETDFMPMFEEIKWQKIYSGIGQWSDRLIALIDQIEADYIFYFQEDFYLTKQQPHGRPHFDIDYLINGYLPENNILRLQISPINQFYSLHGSDFPIFFHPTSKYLVSHQPSIWRKDFLLSCLKPGESPWVNEYEGTKRLQNRPEIRQKIAIYPYDWYEHKCIKGQVVGSI